jgi:hypothetical protein
MMTSNSLLILSLILIIVGTFSIFKDKKDNFKSSSESFYTSSINAISSIVFGIILFIAWMFY